MFYRKLFLFVLVLLTFSCRDKSSNPGDEQPQVTGIMYQVPGCQRNLFKKTSSVDTCFSYSFTDSLKIDFCVSANCCPDRERFSLNYKIETDTIFIAAKDTAADLCDCICPYIIHAEFSNLPLGRYIVCCNYNNKLIYERVVKKQLDLN